MATKKFCDRCGDDITDRDDLYNSKLVLTNQIGSREFDICQSCRDDFNRSWMNPPRAK